MSFYLTPSNAEGAANSTKTGIKFTASSTIILPSTGSTVAGDLIEITGVTITGNNGWYTAVSGTTSVTIAESVPGVSTDAVGSGTAKIYNLNSNPTLQSSTAITAFEAGSVIHAAGANFTGNGVRKGDYVHVTSAAGGTLAGTYRVVSVISRVRISVAGVTAYRTAFGASAGAGNVIVKAGAWEMTVLDEASPTWTKAYTEGIILGGTLAAEVLIDKTTLGDRLTLFTTHGLRWVSVVHTTTTATNWVSEREVLIADRKSAFTGEFRLKTGTATSTGDLVRLGRKSASNDRYGGDFGSNWVGWRIRTTATAGGGSGTFNCSLYESYMSAIVAAGGGNVSSGNAGEFQSSFIDGYDVLAPGNDSSIVGATYTGTFENFMFRSGSVNLVILGTPFSFDNPHIIYASATGVISGVTGYIQGLRVSLDSFTPFLVIISSDVTILNPRKDYTNAQLFTNLGATGRIHYTWNPRFVERGNKIPIPISGLKVRVFKINEADLDETEVTGSPFTTNASGLIPPPAAHPGATLLGGGLDLERRTSTYVSFVGFTTEYSHRVWVEGSGYRRLDAYFTMRSPKTDFDLPIDTLKTDYEGEMST